MTSISKTNDIQNHDHTVMENSELSWIIKEKLYLGPNSLSNMHIIAYSDSPNCLCVTFGLLEYLINTWVGWIILSFWYSVYHQTNRQGELFQFWVVSETYK